MANITTKRTGELLRSLFEILIDHPDGIQAKDALHELKKCNELTEFEKGVYSSGAMRFDKIVRFATIDVVKAGWMIKEKGIWSVTDEGIKAYESLPSPEKFYKEAQRLYREWKKVRASSADFQDDTSIEDKGATVTYEEAEEQAWGEIKEYLSTIPPYDFQKLVAVLLKAMGYHVSWVSPPGKDGGLDILAWNDPLGTTPPRIKVQVKRERNAVSVGTLRSFMAILSDNDVGIFVCTGGFTKDAEDEARNQQSRQVTLINLQRLFELWIEHMDSLSVDERDLLPLKPIYFLAPED